MRLDPELVETTTVPRPAPVAISLHSASNPTATSFVDTRWAFPTRPSADTDESDIKSPAPVRELPHGTSEAPITPRRMSFFDVGGLLGENDPPQVRHRNSLTTYQRQPITSPSPGLLPPITGSRRGSHALLQDIGGLLEDSSPSRTTNFHPSSRSQDPDLIQALQSTPPNSSPRTSVSPAQQRGESHGLQDIGGLLSSSSQATDSHSSPNSPHANPGLIEALQSTPPNSPLTALITPERRRGSQKLQDVGGLLP